MADESVADDEAIYDIWRRLSAFEVDRIFLALFVLAHAFAELRGARPSPDLVDRARALRDGPLGLGYLPVVRSILATVGE